MPTSPATPPPGHSQPPGAGAAPYRSKALEVLSQRLAQGEDPLLLDLGPVCGENINYWAHRARRLYLCDLFLRLDRLLRGGRPPQDLLGHLDYAEGAFDAILLWDLLDRLEEREARLVVRRCQALLRDNGLLLVFAQGERAAGSVYSHVQGRNFMVHPRPQPHLRLPLIPRPNRRVLSLLLPFFPIKSFIYPSGFREFVMQKP